MGQTGHRKRKRQVTTGEGAAPGERPGDAWTRAPHIVHCAARTLCLHCATASARPPRTPLTHCVTAVPRTEGPQRPLAPALCQPVKASAAPPQAFQHPLHCLSPVAATLQRPSTSLYAAMCRLGSVSPTDRSTISGPCYCPDCCGQPRRPDLHEAGGPAAREAQTRVQTTLFTVVPCLFAWADTATPHTSHQPLHCVRVVAAAQHSCHLHLL